MNDLAIIEPEGALPGISLRDALLLAGERGLDSFIHNDVRIHVAHTEDGPKIGGLTPLPHRSTTP